MPGVVQGVAMFLLCASLYGQGITISPNSLKLLQVEGGPIASASISLRSTGATQQSWTATAATPTPDDPWLELSATSGSTPAALVVTIVNWRGEKRKPGRYTGTIMIHSN